MARAINSLPTPDLPEINTGIFDAAAFSATRMTACIYGALGDEVGEAERAGLALLHPRQFAFERAGVERVAQADMQPLGADRLDHEIDGAGAHRRNHIVDAAMRGLHDHRHVDRRLAHFRQHAHAVEIGHHQIEDHAIDPRAVGSGEQSKRRVAGIAHDRLVFELVQRGFKEPALHRIVVDNKNGHECPGGRNGRTLCRFGSLCGRRLKGVLSQSPIPAARGEVERSEGEGACSGRPRIRPSRKARTSGNAPSSRLLPARGEKER